jgi:hypothetical protein
MEMMMNASNTSSDVDSGIQAKANGQSYQPSGECWEIDKDGLLPSLM